jgi:hypothetical protein
MPTCDRCQKTRSIYEGARFRSGSFTEELDDGTVEHYETLCEGCHRDVVRT